MMHEASGKAMLSVYRRHLQIGSVHIDYVILSSRKVAVDNIYMPATSREVDKIGRRGEYSSRLRIGHAVYISERDISTVLAHDTEPVHISYIKILQSGIAAVYIQHAHLPADYITYGERGAFLRTEILGNVKLNTTRR